MFGMVPGKNKYVQVCSKDVLITQKILISLGWISDSGMKEPENRKEQK